MPFQSFQNYAAGCICENLIPRHAFEMPPQSGTPFVPVVSGIEILNLVDLTGSGFESDLFQNTDPIETSGSKIPLKSSNFLAQDIK